MNIENKAILITGANRGIGRALVDEALRRGVKKVYAGTRSALEVADKRVTPLSLDVTDARQVQQAVEQVDSLDVLINNAGIAIYDDLTNFEVIEKHLAVNFLGLLRVTQHSCRRSGVPKEPSSITCLWQGSRHCRSYLLTPLRKRPGST